MHPSLPKFLVSRCRYATQRTYATLFTMALFIAVQDRHFSSLLCRFNVPKDRTFQHHQSELCIRKSHTLQLFQRLEKKNEFRSIHYQPVSKFRLIIRCKCSTGEVGLLHCYDGHAISIKQYSIVLTYRSWKPDKSSTVTNLTQLSNQGYYEHLKYLKGYKEIWQAFSFLLIIRF